MTYSIINWVQSAKTCISSLNINIEDFTQILSRHLQIRMKVDDMKSSLFELLNISICLFVIRSSSEIFIVK